MATASEPSLWALSLTTGAITVIAANEVPRMVDTNNASVLSNRATTKVIMYINDKEHHLNNTTAESMVADTGIDNGYILEC
jgi:hypothetical protein